jgi:hypothetical protein
MKRPKNYDLGSDNDIDTDVNSATHIKKKIATMATAIQPSLRTMADLNVLSTPKAAVRAGPAKSNENSRPLKAFHHFPDLPNELQDEVWNWASYASPNTVSMMIDDEVVRFVATAMIVPAILQATSGSRGIALRHYTLVENSVFDRENHQIQQQPQLPLQLQFQQQMQLLQQLPQQQQQLQLPQQLLQQPPAPLLPGGLHHHFAGLRHHIRGAMSRNAMPRYFYLNTAFDIFHLQIGTAVDHIFPTYVLPPPGQPGMIRSDRSLTENERQREISRLNHGTFVAPPFPQIGKIPAFFKKIKHLALNFSLPTCPHPYSSKLYQNWVEAEIKKFLDGHVRTTTEHFEALRNIDLVVKRDYGTEKKHKDEKSDFKNWRDIPIRMSDGVTFGYIEFAYVEREIRLWFMGEFLGKNDEAPEWRLVVKVPDSSQATK